VSSNDPFVSHYTLDGMGRRVLVGLSFVETTEFEQLDARLPYDRKPICACPVVPLVPAEVRWLELYKKHRASFDAIPLPRS
jgi:hypothetical protein